MIIEINKACDLVIFGTKGDLSRRKLFPALYKLEKYKKIHLHTRIIGIGRADWNTKEYLKIVRISLETFLEETINESVWKTFSNRLIFCNCDFNQKSCFLNLRKILYIKNNTIIYYCAVPPHLLNNIVEALGKAKLNSFPARIILEKPLGRSLKTFKVINECVSKYFLEKQIFRIDHYLGKESILNLMSLRFSNLLFFKNWNQDLIEHVQITVSEQVGIESRWNYFNDIGQTRDMVQNHILQILTIITMNCPKDLTYKQIQNEKIKILSALMPMNINHTVRGQYDSGFIEHKKVLGYLEENHAINNSTTETFIAMKIYINTSEWKGVPFYVRTGKRLSKKYSEIVIYFKKMPINLFKKNNIFSLQNKLIIRLDPNPSIKIDFFNKLPDIDEVYKLQNSQLYFDYLKFIKAHKHIDAYEKLLLASMRGEKSLFVSREEIEASWRWIDPIIENWENSHHHKLKLYRSGTWGPEDSNLMLSQDGYTWYPFCET